MLFSFTSSSTRKVLLSLIVSGIIVIIILAGTSKYTARLVSVVNATDSYNYYEDMDDDGNSEKITLITRYEDRLGVLISTKGRIINQWNIRGAWAKYTPPFIEDFDQDGYKEIFIFTIDKDSVLLHCINIRDTLSGSTTKAVCRIFKTGDKYDYVIFPCGTYDRDGDGFPEFYFSVRAGFATIPRNMFSYNPGKDEILRSPESCSSIFYPVMFDMDHDGVPEFFSGITLATYNCEADRAYSDMYNWLMVFTPELQFKFPPVRLEEYPAISWFTPYYTGSRHLYLALHYYRGTGSFPNFIALYDNGGNMVRKKHIAMDEDWYYSALFSRDDNYEDVYILRHDSIIGIDSLLNLQFIKKLHKVSQTSYVQKLDIDKDGEKELMLTGEDYDNIKIFRNDFSYPVSLKLHTKVTPCLISAINTNGEASKISISNDESFYIFEYNISPLHQYKYFLFIPVFLVLLSIVFFIYKIREYRRLQIDNTQRTISELQVKSIQSQLDPHFTFNIFTSFANLINEKDAERADFVITKYAALLKASIMNSEDIHITLQEELDFVNNYLELEKFRYPGKISFSIVMADEIDKNMRLPKMLLHIFVENAVKHGLRHKESGGEIIIGGFREGNAVHISIRDNGVGREKAKEFAGFSTGKGLTIIDQILESYNKLNRIKITYEILDLYENGKASGTQVNIRVPVKQS